VVASKNWHISFAIRLLRKVKWFRQRWTAAIVSCGRSAAAIPGWQGPDEASNYESTRSGRTLVTDPSLIAGRPASRGRMDTAANL